MIKSVQIKLLTTITIIFLYTAESNKCLHDDKQIRVNKTESTTPAVALTPEQIATHNQNAATAVNKLLPPTVKPTVVDKPATQDSMDGGVDLGAPAKADDTALWILYHPDIKTAKEFLQTSDEVRANQKLSGDKAITLKDNTDNTNGYKLITNKKSTVTSFNNLNKATKVENHLSDGTKITTDLHPETGKKTITTISTPPVKSGWFSKTGTTTKIIHHADGTHTATTTTTTYSLFGKTSDVTVNKLNNQAETTATFKPGTKTSRGWDGSTTTTTVHADGSTSTQVKSLFGTPISSSGAESNGSQINANDPYNVE